MQQQLAEENIMERVRAIASTTPHWTVFFQHVFGLNGIVRTHLPDINDRKRFYTTPNFKLILGAMQDLRSRKLSCQQEETTRVITVRLPKSMHEQLVEEAHEERTSLNKLCLTKLLEPVESEHVPLTINPPSKRNRDTRPAPQPLNRPRKASLAFRLLESMVQNPSQQTTMKGALVQHAIELTEAFIKQLPRVATEDEAELYQTLVAIKKSRTA